MPAVYQFGEGARVGGLLCYGPDQIDVIRRSASYIDRILKGEKPAELRRCEYELVINLKAAKALGPTVPPSLDHRRRVVILAKRPLADDRKRKFHSRLAGFCTARLGIDSRRVPLTPR